MWQFGFSVAVCGLMCGLRFGVRPDFTAAVYGVCGLGYARRRLKTVQVAAPNVPNAEAKKCRLRPRNLTLY